jgi:putative nucleotidyltransferase with HDIG domain
VQVRESELIRSLSSAVRAVRLCSPEHPNVSRAVGDFSRHVAGMLARQDRLTLGFDGGTVLINGTRLPRTHAPAPALTRLLCEREADAITFSRGVTQDEIRAFLVGLAQPPGPSDASITPHVALGRLARQEEPVPPRVAAARELYAAAVTASRGLWEEAKAGGTPDAAAARRAVDGLAELVTTDRPSLLALTSARKCDEYTFTHMVNVAALTMVQARALGLEGALVGDFGVAGLLHDIGKVKVPGEILDKPDALTREEFAIMKRHVVDGAHVLRRTPGITALAPIVAFEHHLKQDLSGYPENAGRRELNLCTMLVTIADVYDALRSNRVYREGLPTDRIRAIMTQRGTGAFNQTLLQQFVAVMGTYPVGTLVRLDSGELAVVTAVDDRDPLQPDVKVIADRHGSLLPAPLHRQTSERDAQGGFRYSVMEAVDPAGAGIDPLGYL